MRLTTRIHGHRESCVLVNVDRIEVEDNLVDSVRIGSV